jgi:hypothetical protein
MPVLTVTKDGQDLSRILTSMTLEILSINRYICSPVATSSRRICLQGYRELCLDTVFDISVSDTSRLFGVEVGVFDGVFAENTTSFRKESIVLNIFVSKSLFTFLIPFIRLRLFQPFAFFVRTYESEAQIHHLDITLGLLSLILKALPRAFFA